MSWLNRKNLIWSLKIAQFKILSRDKMNRETKNKKRLIVIMKKLRSEKMKTRIPTNNNILIMNKIRSLINRLHLNQLYQAFTPKEKDRARLLRYLSWILKRSQILRKLIKRIEPILAIHQIQLFTLLRKNRKN